jgi:hypothetical protein
VEWPIEASHGEGENQTPIRATQSHKRMAGAAISSVHIGRSDACLDYEDTGYLLGWEQHN